MAIIAILTDFGLKDGNVGVMKGVIWSICPQAQIADVSHTVHPQDVREASLILSRSTPYFPDGTVHLAVVDPGVGTGRRGMAAQIGSSYFVGPDNGIITYWLERTRRAGDPEKFLNLDRPQFWLPEVSHVFHGRDIFAPAAAHLASGLALRHLGTPFHDPVLLSLPRPVHRGHSWTGEVIHIDHFGNVTTNIRQEQLADAMAAKEQIGVSIGGIQIAGLVDTFGERPQGALVALIGSTGNLIVSVVNGDAAAQLKVGLGDPVQATLPSTANGLR
jgi:S-adenosylmethionine hydrolase